VKPYNQAFMITNVALIVITMWSWTPEKSLCWGWNQSL